MGSSSPPKPQKTPPPPQLVTLRSRDGAGAFYDDRRRSGLRVDLNNPATLGSKLTIPPNPPVRPKPFANNPFGQIIMEVAKNKRGG